MSTTIDTLTGLPSSNVQQVQPGDKPVSSVAPTPTPTVTTTPVAPPAPTTTSSGSSSAVYAPDVKDSAGNVTKSGDLIGYKDSTGKVTYTRTPVTDTATNALTNPKPIAQYENDAYASLMPMYSDTIKAITDKYASTIEDTKRQGENALGETRAQSAAAGLMGSPEAATYQTKTQGLTDSAVAKLRASQVEEVNAVLNNVRTNAATLAQAQASQDMTSAQNAITARDKARTDALDSVSRLAAIPTFDLEKFKNTPDYQALLDHSGLSDNELAGAFVNATPQSNILQTWNVGSMMYQVVQDPRTKQTKVQSVDMGVSPPTNWTMQKIGTNSVMYYDPAKFNPADPSTYKTFAIDPLTGLPVAEGAGSGFKTDLSSTNAQKVVNATSTMMGVPSQDVTLPVSQVVDKYGMSNIVSGLIKQEGGSPEGVENNPGNIKFAGLPGQIDSGVAAQDGGTFASYKTSDAGIKAVEDLVKTNSAKPLSDFIASYKGVNLAPDVANLGTDKSGSSITAVAGVSLPVFNYLTQGVSSMTRMSTPQRNAIMKQAEEFLNKNGLDVSTFQSRYKAYNEVLSANIQRQQKTAIMENELTGTIDNLKTVSNTAGLSDTNLANVGKILLGQQVNDPIANQYAFHFEQLKNELAGYFAASQGKNSPDVIDNQDAASAIASGLSTKGLEGLDTAVKNSTTKMSNVMQGSVDKANQDVWTLFGVGDKYPSQKNIVEQAFNNAGIKYNDAISKVPKGSIMVVDKKTKQVGSIPIEEYDPSLYIRA